jgi:hypothetical protein
LNEEHPSAEFEISGYAVHVSLDQLFGHGSKKGFGLISANGSNEFIGAGTGFRVAFTPKTEGPSHAGIGYVEEGEFENGAWVPGRRLNGDENDQGGYWRFSDFGPLRIEKVTVYRWK